MNTWNLVVVWAALGALPIAAADTLVPVEQARSISTFVNAPQCGPDFLSDEVTANGFGPFDETLKTSHDCDSGTAASIVSQQSEIGSESITAEGTASSEAHGPVPGVVHAFGNSTASVTFELTAACAFALSGEIAASSSDNPIIVLTGASVALTDADGRTIVAHSVVPGPGGELNSVAFEERGVLEPGEYELTADAGTFIDNDVPPSTLAQASFEISFDLTILGDLDGDGEVGILDFLALLAAWGPCPGEPDPCPGDLDGDGMVGITDLLILLANWG